jgi:hypothetical protein
MLTTNLPCDVGLVRCTLSSVRRQGGIVPYTSVAVRGIALLCFPPEDAVFARLARDSVTGAQGDDPAATQAALRRIYPHAVVVARHRLASFGGEAWYVYRDGRFSPFVESAPWWEDPSVARVVIAPDGEYLDANEPALALLGVALEELRAARSGDFTVPEYRVAVPWILQLVQDTGVLHSTSMLRRRDGAPDEPVEFHLVWEAEGPGRHVAWMRRVPLEAVRPPDASPDALTSGGEVGGRPVAPEHRDDDGHVDGQRAERAERRECGREQHDPDE